MDPSYYGRLPNARGAYHQISDNGPSYPMLPNKQAAQSVTSFAGSSYKQEVLSAPLKNPRKSFSWHLFSYVVSILWLAPIASLLALNFTNHVIGASAWCPFGRCSADIFSDDAFKRAKQLDRDDHNTLGTLQFVAKALEVWFMLIATSLIYDVSMIIAKRGGGLPVGYFLTHLEFGDIRNLFNPLLYTSPIPHPNGNQPRRAGTVKLYLFAVLVVFLTILTNLMGPATAVLVLPTLQWIDTKHVLEQRFNSTGAALPPGWNSQIDLPGCDSNALSLQDYSCTREYYGSTLDTCASFTNQTIMQNNLTNGLPYLSVLQERAVQFTLNVSAASNTIWIPNRQALAALSDQYIDFVRATLGLEKESRSFNNSLQTILNRQGPAIALQTTCFSGNVTEINLATEKDVICYSGWSNDAHKQYYKCFPYGSAWNTVNNQYWFYLGSPSSASSNNHTAVISNYMTDRALYYNEETDFGSGILECFKGSAAEIKSCDWDKIFSTPMTGDLRNSSTNVGIIEYDTPIKPTNDSRIWCDSIAYTSFPTYSLDTFPYSNPNALIQVVNMTNPDEKSTPILVHPTWLLAAMSVNQNETVDGDRPFATEMARVISSMFDLSSTGELTADQTLFINLHSYSLGQAMSMINYDMTDASSEFPEDADHPIFRHWAARHVWAFSLSGRTAKLGVAVVVAGSACVLLRVILAIVGGAHDHSIVELFVAALEHIPRGEFLSYRTEKTMAKVRYELTEDHDGKPQFKPERNGGYTPSGHGYAFPTPSGQQSSTFPSPALGTPSSAHGTVQYDAGSYSSGSYGFGGTPSRR